MPAFTGYYNTKSNDNFEIPGATPVSVIASFNTSGELIPLYVQIVEEEERISKKIEAIRRVNDKNAVLEFDCYIKIQNSRKEITLIFHIGSRKWFLK